MYGSTPEAMLFGTARKLATTPKRWEVEHKERFINATTSHKYLGVQLDSTVTMQEHFTSTYRKVSSRLTFL